MYGYLGQTVVEQKDTPYKDFGRLEWSMFFLERYAGIYGAHHKDWVFDQMARLAKGTTLTIELAKWENGTQEYRVSTGEPSKEYLDWVKEMRGEYNEEEDCYEYGYDEGIAP